VLRCSTELRIKSMYDAWNDKDSSVLELRAAFEFWSVHHNQGSRKRLRAAIRYFRAWHKETRR
jgi:hypothetical protein